MDELLFPHLEEVLNRYGEYLREKLKMNLLEDGSNASGELVNSLEYIVSKGSNYYEVSISLLDYYKYLNDGTKPHWAPRDAIRKWIEVKPVIPHVSSGRVPTVEQLAYLIQRKIARDGTKGTGFFDRGVEDANSRFLIQIEEALHEDLDNNLDTLLLPLMNIK